MPISFVYRHFTTFNFVWLWQWCVSLIWEFVPNNTTIALWQLLQWPIVLCQKSGLLPSQHARTRVNQQHAIIIKTAVKTVAFMIPAMIVKAMVPTMTALAMMTSPSNALACYQVDAPVSLEWMCGEILLLAKWYVVCLLIGLDKGRTNYWHVAKLCLPTFLRQIALYSPCRLSSVVRFCHH